MVLRGNEVVKIFRGNPLPSVIGDWMYESGTYKSMKVEDKVWRDYLTKYICELLKK